MALYEGIGCAAAHQVPNLKLLAMPQCQTLLHCDISDDVPSQVAMHLCRKTMTQIRRACLTWMLRSSQLVCLQSSQLVCLQSSLKQAARTKCHLHGASQQLVDEGQVSRSCSSCCCHCCCSHPVLSCKGFASEIFAAWRQAVLYSYAMLSLSCCDQYMLVEPLLLIQCNWVCCSSWCQSQSCSEWR